MRTPYSAAKTIWITVILSMLVPTLGWAQDWKVTEPHEIERSVADPCSNIVLHLTEVSGFYVLKCHSSRAGRPLWHKTFEDFEVDTSPMFVSARGDVVIGANDSLYFFDGRSGASLAQLGICDGDWDNLINRHHQSHADFRWLDKQPSSTSLDKDQVNSLLETHIDDSLLILYFDGCIQFVDLIDRRTILRSSESPDRPLLVRDGRYAMLVNGEDGKKMYVIDYKTREVIYRHTYAVDTYVQRDYFEVFKSHLNRIVYFTENSAVLLALDSACRRMDFEYKPNVKKNTSRRRRSKAKKRLPNFRTVCTPRDFWLIREVAEGNLVYDLQTGRELWQVDKGAGAATLDTVIVLDDGVDALWCTHDKSGWMHLTRLNMSTGDVKWTKRMTRQEEPYRSLFSRKVPYYQFAPSALEFGIFVNLVGQMRVDGSVGVSAVPGVGVKPPVPHYMTDTARYFDAETEAVFKPLFFDSKQLTGLIAGRVYGGTESKSRDVEYDGERIFTIDLENGKLLNEHQTEILANREYEGIEFNQVETPEEPLTFTSSSPFRPGAFNAQVLLSMRQTLDYALIVASQKVIVVRSDGTIEEQDYFEPQAEGHLTSVVHNHLDGGMIVRARMPGFKMAYWTVNPGSIPFTTHLNAVSDLSLRNLTDSTRSQFSYHLKADKVSAFPLQTDPLNLTLNTDALWALNAEGQPTNTSAAEWEQQTTQVLSKRLRAKRKHTLEQLPRSSLEFSATGELLYFTPSGVYLLSPQGEIISQLVPDNYSRETQLGIFEFENSFVVNRGDFTYVLKRKGGKTNSSFHEVDSSALLSFICPQQGMLILINKDKNEISGIELE